MNTMGTGTSVLTIAGLKKAFGGTRAVDGIGFQVSAGTIHAFLGGNGSGKSTTIKILSGMYRADAGEIEIAGERHEARAWTAAKARTSGLRFVHQQSSTFPELTVADNLAIGHGYEKGLGGRVRWRAQRRRATAVLDRFGLDIDPAAQLAQYGVATHAIIAIARALQDVELRSGESGESILVLDEPTAALPPQEVKVLLGELKRFAAEGQTIIYVTHRLDEVLQVANRATVLRDGRVARTLDGPEIDHGTLVSAITGGEELPAPADRAAKRSDAPRLRCDGLVGGAVRGAALEVFEGEIVGVGGLLGSGRSTLLRLLAGAATREEGEVTVEGVPVRFRTPRDAVRAGLGYSPEDRRTTAAFMNLSVRENIEIAATARYFRAGRLRHRSERADTRALLKTYQVRAASSEVPLGTLSGGNQQKALLARWLQLGPKLLLLDEPTEGVDVGARAEIWQLVRRAANDGAAALVVSSDFEELVATCDRVIVLCRGRTLTDLYCDGLTESALTSVVLEAEGDRR